MNTDKNGKQVSTQAAQEFIASITPDKVLSVYSGKLGCMCGCRGNHSYNPLYVEESTKEAGCEPDFSSRSVSLILNKVKKVTDAALQRGHIIHVKSNGRQYAVYLRHSASLSV